MTDRSCSIGATGHIGGAFLEELLSMKNDNQISALVRGKDAGRKLTQRYKSPPYNANLAFVTGDLDSLDTLESESAKADIVVNAGPDITHDAGISAILRGLSCQPRKSYYIHTSGAASIWDRGDGTSKVWDDIADISTLTSLPETAHHRVTDKLVFDAHCNVNVAIISPGHVYGIGPSEFHPAPLTTGPLLTLAKVVGAGFIMNEGKNVQGYVHVRDLARMYLAMVEDALCGVANEGSREELWGPQAYYWAGSQNYSGKEISVALAPVLAKYNIIPAVEVKNSTYGKGPSVAHPACLWLFSNQNATKVAFRLEIFRGAGP